MAPYTVRRHFTRLDATVFPRFTASKAACGREAIRDYRPMQPGDVPATFADVGAIAADLGFAPSTPLDVGVPRFVGWYRDYTGQ